MKFKISASKKGIKAKINNKTIRSEKLFNLIKNNLPNGVKGEPSTGS